MVTIIIPIYNAEQYLYECLESVLNQTYTEWECILINDGSSDNSEKICQHFINKDNRFIYYHQENQGVSLTRNRGIKEAKGEYIYFLDADDYISNNCIELLMKECLKYNNPDIICAQVQTLGITKIHYPFASEKKHIQGSLSIQKSYYNHEWNEMPWNKLIRREFIIKNQIYFYSHIRHEDTLWSFITALYAESLLLIPIPTYFYRIHNNNFITSHNYKVSSDSLLVVCAEMKRHINKKRDEIKDAQNYFMNFTTNIFISYFIRMDYSINYKYEAYKTIRKLLNETTLYPYLTSSIPNGLKLLQIHQILPSKLGYYYICLIYNFFKSRSK